jgi:hypothetical protein
MNKQENKNKATTLRIEKILKKLLEDNKKLKSITMNTINRDGKSYGFEVTRRSKLKYE